MQDPCLGCETWAENIDKFEMALQATEYISEEKDKDLSSFILDAKKDITLPLVKILMKNLFHERRIA